MSSSKLKNAPLKEVIFELHWDLSTDVSGVKDDPGFELAVGKFHEKLKSHFPLHRKLIVEGAPIRIIGAPLYQYWKGELRWPVIQHGKGMIAVNDTEQGYEWESSFKPLLLDTVMLVIDSYEVALKFNRAKLQYIDAVDMEDLAPIEFMAQNLQTEIKTTYKLPGDLKGFIVQQNYEKEDGSTVNLTISNGVNNQNQKPTVVWTTNIEKRHPFSVGELESWVEEAHESASEIFKQMLNEEYYASLDR